MADSVEVQQQAQSGGRGPACIASFIAAGSAISVVAREVANESFTLCLFTLLALGYASSYAAGTRHTVWAGVARTAQKVGLVCVPFLSLLVSLSVLIPQEALAGSEDLQKAIFVAWFTVGVSFFLGMSVAGHCVPLAFPVIPSLSLFGLMATINVNADIWVSFAIFVAASLFCVSYESHLREAPAAIRSLGERILLRQHVAVSAALFLPSIALGGIIALLLHAVTPPAVPVTMSYLRSAYYSRNLWGYMGFLDSFGLAGGSYVLSKRELMKVTTDRPANLRGAVYTQYTGHGWRRVRLASEKPSVVRRSSNGWFQVLDGSLPPSGAMVSTRVEVVDYSAGNASSILYSQGLPIAVQAPNTASLRVERQSCLRASHIVEKGNVYTVVSFVNDPESAAAPSWREPEPVDPAYTEFRNEEFPEAADRVAALAARVTQGLDSPLDKAVALSSYLGIHCRYSLSPPYVPPDRDAVDFFLFTSRRGACDLFATSLAILCRAVGIPSRLITGFALGEASEGTYVVREKDAHAWVEVLIPRAGWIALDPTVGAAPEPASMVARLFKSRWVQSAERVISRHAKWVLGLALLLILVRMQWAPLYYAVTGQRHTRSRLRDRRQRLTRLYMGMCGKLARAGVRRRQSDTPYEYQHRVAAGARTSSGLRAALSSVCSLTEVFVTGRYGPHQPGNGEVYLARQYLSAVQAALRRKNRREGEEVHGS